MKKTLRSLKLKTLASLLLCPLFIGGAAQAAESFHGEIVHVIEDYEDHRYKEYALLKDRDSNKTKRLHLKSLLLMSEVATLRSGQEVSVKGSLKSGSIEVESLQSEGPIVGDDLFSRAKVFQGGSRSMLVIGMSFKSDLPTCGTDDAIKKMTIDASNPTSVVNFVKENSNGAFSLSGNYASVNINIDLEVVRTCDTIQWADLADEALRAKGIEPDDYDHTMYVMPGKTGCGFGGQAYVNANRSWIKSCSAKTFSHELGHNFGLHHSATPGYEYGDASDTMGGANRRINAPKREQLGWIDLGRVQLIEPSGNHQLSPLNDQAGSAAQILKINRPSKEDVLYISYRDASGDHDKNMGAAYVDQINFHTFKPGVYDKRSYFLGAIDPGESFPLQELGGYVRFDGFANGVASLSFHQGEITGCTKLAPVVAAINPYPYARVERGQAYSGQIKIVNQNTAACEDMELRYSPLASDSSLTFSHDTPSIFKVASGETKYLNFKVQTTQQTGLDRHIVHHFIWQTGDTSYPSYKNVFYVDPSIGTSTDTVAPTVSLVSPAEGAKFEAGAQISASANASDNVGVSKVQFYLNGALKCEDSSSPYTCSLVMPDGNGKIEARAFDAAGNSSSSSANVANPESTIVDTEAPSAPTSISAAKKGKNNIGLSYYGARDNVGVVLYKIYRNGAYIGSSSSTSYSDSKMAAGTYSYAVKAVDAAGNVSTLSSSASITIGDSTGGGGPSEGGGKGRGKKK